MKMIINGQAVNSSDGKTIDVSNPATGALIDTIPSATQADVDAAVAAAKAAQPIWALVPIYKKVEIINKFLELVEKNRESLARGLSDEAGKAIVEARIEINNIFTAFRAFCEKAKHLYDEVIPPGLEPGHECNMVMVKREPIGIVACIIPFNFPCNLFDQKVAPTLLAGNAAIVKPSTDDPLTLCKLVALLNEAGVTPGAIQILTGRGSLVGRYLCGHKDVHAISLTGSTEVGIETAKVAAGHLAHVALELGGNDPFIIMPDADLDLAVAEMIPGRMFNSGQICCSSKRFIVHNSVKQAFINKLVVRLSQIKQGAPSDECTQMGCLISEKAAIDVEAQIKLTVQQGGKIILGGERSGAFVQPTIITDVPPGADVMRDLEVFGPVVPITGFDTEDEAISIANNSIYGLCGCVFTRDMKTAFRVCNALDCGGAVINGSGNLRSFEMPFGGFKQSGVGKEGVYCTFDKVTRQKTIAFKNIF